MQQPIGNKKSEIYRVRRSRTILVGRLIVTQGIIIFFHILVRTILTLSIPSEQANVEMLFSINMVFIIIIQSANLYLVLRIIMRWLSEYYIIAKDEIIIKKGFFKINKHAFAIEKVESVNISQSIFGKVFNFGTITIFNPALNQTVHLRNITNPHFYANKIKANFEKSTPLVMQNRM